MSEAAAHAKTMSVKAVTGISTFALCAVLLVPRVGATEDLRDFCPDRPGLGTPACIIDRGHGAVELGLLDWTLERRPGSRTDTLVAGDLLVRYGLDDQLEAQLGWVAFGHLRTRSDGIVDRGDGTGDVMVALRQSVRNAHGSGLSAAVMPYGTLPTGGSSIGAGDWGVGLLVPVGIELPAGFGLGLTGDIKAAVDADRDGRHLAYGGVIGLDVPFGAELGATFELAATRDRDAAGAVTELRAAVSAAWSPGASLQFDAGANVGLNRDTPDLQGYVGVARRF